MGDVELLLDEGSWTIARTLSTAYAVRRLADQTRQLILTYGSHRFRALTGVSGEREVSVCTIRALLRS